jgi:superfamily II DNA or RNA helicase
MPRDFRGVSASISKLQFSYIPPGEEERETFRCYKETEDTIILPRYYGLSKWPQLSYDHGGALAKNTRARLQKREAIELRPEQVPWVQDICMRFQMGATDIVAAAATGKGKTVMALQVASTLRQPTLIVVDQENLRDQWIERIGQHLGIDPGDIGVLQGNQRTYGVSGYTVAMIQTLYRRRETLAEFLSQFGFAVFDECHTVGAPRFSEALFAVPARYRLGISATPDRRDSFDKVLKWHLGPTQVRMLDQHDKSSVRVIENYTTTSWYANTSPKAGRYINELAADPERNWIIVEVVRWFLEHGRRAIIMSDRIDHLASLIDACEAAGVSGAEWGTTYGLYARYFPQWKYAKEAEPQRHPAGWQRKTEYTPVCLQQVRTRKKKADLDFAMSRQIIFATYGMFSKGVDLPELDAGLDATPRTFFEQIHGRILRNMSGKVKPVWVTIRDVNSQRAEHQFKTRIKELALSNVEVYRWDLQKGAVKRATAGQLADEANCRSRMLKSIQIETDSDGRNTLTIRSMQRTRGGDSGPTTGKRANSRPVGRRRSPEVDSSPERRAKNVRSTPATKSTRRRSSFSATPSGKRVRRSAAAS